MFILHFSLGQNAFTRAYINFQSYEDVYNFKDQFDEYVFVDGKGIYVVYSCYY